MQLLHDLRHRRVFPGLEEVSERLARSLLNVAELLDSRPERAGGEIAFEFGWVLLDSLNLIVNCKNLKLRVASLLLLEFRDFPFSFDVRHLVLKRRLEEVTLSNAVLNPPLRVHWRIKEVLLAFLKQGMSAIWHDLPQALSVRARSPTVLFNELG
jgi:hypothetical protein